MAFDGFVTNAVIAELKKYLIKGKITKIYEPNKNEILLGIYSNHMKYCLCLNISSHYGAHLTTNAKPNPLNAPNFCMTLRKHLIGFHISDISCNGLERIITIELKGYNELNDITTKKLIVELMGKHSNIILVNENNVIIDALRHFDTLSGSLRNILSSYEYLIPNANKLDISKLSLEQILENLSKKNANFLPMASDELPSLSDYVLTHLAGISKQLVKYSISFLGLEDILTKENLVCLLEYFAELYQSSQTQNVSLLPFEEDYTLVIKKKEDPLAINFFLDDFYTQKELQEEFINFRNAILNVILNKLKKIQKKLSSIEVKLQECNNLERFQLYGELLTSYLYCLTDEHTSSVELENYYDNNQKIEIPLDISLTPAENAKKYFKKYHKLKNTKEIVSNQKSQVEKEITYLESILYELQLAKNVEEINVIYEEIKGDIISSNFTVNRQIACTKPSKPQSDVLKYTVDGFTVLVGKNNKQNDYLTTKIATAEDIWFHTKDFHGSHVILKTNHQMPSQETINQVASIAAYYSKAGQSSNIPVDYTYAKYVKKPSKAKPGMVTYTNQKTVNVQPKI